MLMGLFGKVGLRTNINKTIGMVCQTVEWQVDTRRKQTHG